MWCTYTMEYDLAIKKKRQCHLQQHGCTRDYQAKWSKSETQRQIYYDLYVDSKTWHKWAYLSNIKRHTDI